MFPQVVTVRVAEAPREQARLKEREAGDEPEQREVEAWPWSPERLRPPPVREQV